MNARYSIRREAEGIELPFGAAGVAVLAAGTGGLIGLLLPASVLETLSFHLYLDTFTAFAKPPFGLTAKLLGALLLALLAGGAAFAFARWSGVIAAPDGLAGLLDRIRGVGRDDEYDAPPLRSADRHPDAPARRPFSAMRDIPDRSWTDQDGAADLTDGEPSYLANDCNDDDADDGELLLNSAFVPDDGAALPLTAMPEPTYSPSLEPLVIGSDDSLNVNPSDLSEIDDFDLKPPSLDDWEIDRSSPAVMPADPQSEPAISVRADDLSSLSVGATAPTVPKRRETSPLDLSAARLDDLIARLEAGLTRKSAYLAPAIDSAGDQAAGNRMPSETDVAGSDDQDDDPAFPHDPALAAALATLRRMSQRAG